MKVLCSICGRKKQRSNQSYCNKCHAEYSKINRKPYSVLSDLAKKKNKARAYLNVYLRRGKIKKGSCSVCGSNENLEAHHTDYDKPLQVEWFCRLHHLKEHYDEVNSNNFYSFLS